jgi:AraC-like DNA-binding protein
MTDHEALKAAFKPVDPLGEALHSLRMSGTFYCRSELTAPWAIEMPEIQDCLMFHVVTVGSCWVEVPGAESRLLRAGDFVLVPHGRGHLLTSEPGLAPAQLFDLHRELLSERYEVIRHGGGGEETTMVCGAVRFDHPAALRFIGMLPKIIVIEATMPGSEWILNTIRFMIAEAKVMRPGGETIITRVSDILVIQAIRSWLENDANAKTGWLGALQDKQIGQAIAWVHRDPMHPWTVASLAAKVGMSRSAFAARFMSLVGEGPMYYVRRWRMHVAVTWLKENDAPIGELAEQLGYQSEAAFSRAFKKFIGVTPGSVRRSAA